MKFVCWHVFFLNALQLVNSAGTNYDPYRWIISYKKQASQSTTDHGHYASFATDGDFNGLGTNYSLTLPETVPTFQIDLGESVAVSVVHIRGRSSAGISSLTIRVGDNPTADSQENAKCFEGSVSQSSRKDCKKKGRYVSLIRKHSGTSALKLIEVAVYRIPIENLAFKRDTARSTVYKPDNESPTAVDMIYKSIFRSKGGGEKLNELQWIRVNLDDTYLVHEVLIFARHSCCESGANLDGFELRVGESLANNGNDNPLCAKDSLIIGEIRSCYCDMFGRYVNINRQEKLWVAEIIVNPETTDNIATLTNAHANIAAFSSNNDPSRMVDTDFATCYLPEMKDESKTIWINLGADYNVAMIRIVNNADKLNQLKDFQIAVGMSNVFTDSTLCLPGLQSMDGIFAKSFVCEPDRILGNHVFIHQERKDLQLSICEIGVFEETKPKIMERSTNRYAWRKQGGEITLHCDGVKGNPAPVFSWVKDNVIIKTGSSHLRLENLKSNDTGVYACWANNTNGFDARVYQINVTSELRTCVKRIEVKFQTDRPSAGIDETLWGTRWYKFYDAQKYSDLQFREAIPPKQVPSCTVWMKGGHPSLQDGVVSRTLCVKNTTHDCSRKLDIYVRRCTHYYVYNFRDLRELSDELILCMKSAQNLLRGLQPVMTSATRQYTLCGKIFHSEENVKLSQECLMLCQLDTKCKSFNHSQKLQICELNSGTKKEFPRKFVSNSDFDYHQLKRGIVKREL